MWTIDELVERVRAALAAEYPGAPNGRVRDVPDRRAIRWYATTGLIDRPAMQGRVAQYGVRHLLQLVALKRRQAAGLTLAEIQAELTGAPNRILIDIARIPPGQVRIAEDFGERSAAPERPRFWTDDEPATVAASATSVAAPSPSASSTVASASAGPAAGSASSAAPAAGGLGPSGGRPPRRAFSAPRSPAEQASAVNTEPAPPATVPAGTARPFPAAGRSWDTELVAGATAVPLGAVALGGGVVLLLPGLPGEADCAAITEAARPLVSELLRRGLVRGGPSGVEPGGREHPAD